MKKKTRTIRCCLPVMLAMYFGYFCGLAQTGLFAQASIRDARQSYLQAPNTEVNDLLGSYVFTIAPELHLAAERFGDMLRLIATGTPSTQWRIETRGTVAGTNAWHPLANIILGPSPIVLQYPIDSSNRFYRGEWLP